MAIDEDLLAQTGLKVPTILLPADSVQPEKWAVVACDQYTSEPEYWDAVDATVGDSPSTLRTIYPEVYLEEADGAGRVERINARMRGYLQNGTLQPTEPGFVFVERTMPSGKRRLGLMVAIDLDQYDFSPDSTSLVRATEGTILDRLPPRIKIRENAPIELPHIMVLIDDPARTVIEPLLESPLPKAYDFELMQGGGHLSGKFVREASSINKVTAALAELATPANMKEKYGAADRGVLLYAMGDGNHSLATAKAIWTKMKESGEASPDHPARYALVELVNLHDASLEFEPIHRVLFDVDAVKLFADLEKELTRLGATVSFSGEKKENLAALLGDTSDKQVIPFVVANKEWKALYIENAPHTLPVGTLQNFLDGFLKENGGTIDYVHGDETVEKLVGNDVGRVGFFLPTIAKHDLFRTVLNDGPLPRKAFSMGEAHEKRFYMEARKIVP